MTASVICHRMAYGPFLRAQMSIFASHLSAYGSRLDIARVCSSPYALQDLVMGRYASSADRKLKEQLVLGRRRLHRIVRDGHRPVSIIYAQVSLAIEPTMSGRVSRLPLSQGCFNPCYQFSRREGLDDRDPVGPGSCESPCCN